LGEKFEYGYGHYGIDVPQDKTEAVRLYRLAAARGHVRAQNRLGRMFCLGQGVAQDYAEAERWYCLAAAQGNAGAQSRLGCMLWQRLSDGVLRLAAAQEDAMAVLSRLPPPPPPPPPRRSCGLESSSGSNFREPQYDPK
jgi:TPR repeat protein